jgi:hypothetical protein
MKKKIFESKPEGRRRKERPRLRWLKYIKNNLREIKIKRWRHNAMGREKWVAY